MKNILITGVSTGIGYGCTQAFLNSGYRVFGSVRKKEHAQKLQEEFGENFLPLVFDVTDHQAIKKSAVEVEEMLKGATLDGLINNAGISVSGPVSHIPIDNFRKQFEVNFFGQIAVTQAFLPIMGMVNDFEGKAGRIVMMSSVSGRSTLPFMGPYSASKYALEAISDALRRELMAYGIDVVVIEPGPVKTAIWDKGDDKAIESIKDTRYYGPVKKFSEFMMDLGANGIELDVFSQQVLKIFESRNPKTRYVITKDKLKNFTLPGLLPDKWVDAALGKMLGLKKE